MDSQNNCPSIVLRKGKTELKIENPAAVIKKINEMYPTDSTYTGWNKNWNKVKRESSDVERNKQIRWMSAAKDWFKNEMFGGTEDFEVIVTNSIEPSDKENTTKIDTPCVDVASPFPSVPSTPPIQSVNKNAYEIRTDILSMALGWVKWQAEQSIAISDRNGNSEKLIPTQLPNGDSVLDVAKKFYSFVEARRY